MSLWHVESGNGDEIFLGTLPEALEYSAGKMSEWAEFEHEAVYAFGESKQYEDAYQAFMWSERYANIADNLRNIHKQVTSRKEDRAPLYQGEDWKEKLREAWNHVRSIANLEGPAGFFIWPCNDEGAHQEERSAS